MAKAKFVPYIDRMCRGFGEDFFGKEAMDQITDEQVETARIEAFIRLSEYVAKYGAEPGNKQFAELFCNYVFENYM